MPKNLKIVIVFVIFSGLVLPNFNILAKPLGFNPASFVGAAFVAQAEVYPVQSAKLFNGIIVVGPASQTQAVAPTGATFFNSCRNGGSGMTGNLIQDTGLLNLNQPAGCFSLSLGKVTAVAGLAVRPLRSLASEVKAVAAKPVILSDSLNPFPGAGRSVPMLPGVAPFMAVAVFAGLEKIKHKPAKTEPINPAGFAGFFRFEILRC